MSDAADLIEALGFCAWAPVARLDFPNLADAMGETAWSVMGVSWHWKDDLHLRRQAYYARIVGGQPGFIAPDFLPDFVAAIGGRSLRVERDPVRLYEQGRLSHAAYAVFEHLRSGGPATTRDLRRAAGGPALDRALVDLQRRFVICKSGVTGHTRGTYSYVWELAERFWPDAFAEAEATAPSAARARIRGRLEEFGIAADPALETRLFLWKTV